jgi:hypothetical protein
MRIIDLQIPPGEAPVVILQDSGGRGLATGASRFEFNEPGQWGFFDTGARHEISNSGDGRLELIEVEVRRRAPSAP